MMGLERLFRNLYGSTPQIDMDLQIARVRVLQPMELDFAKLADGITRNNVGTASILLRVKATARDGKAILHPTGQTFSLEGEIAADSTPVERTFMVHNWEHAPSTVLKRQD